MTDNLPRPSYEPISARQVGRLEAIPAPGRPLIGIVSDDLTGANAVGAMFVSRGVPARTLLGPEPVAGTVVSEPVLVIDTATRDTGMADAARAAGAAARYLTGAGVSLIAQRIDSTLRGNIATELRALLEALPAHMLAVVVPAAPEAGRTARGGRVYLGGRRLTAVAGDQDDVPALLAEESGLPPSVPLDLAVVGGGAAGVRNALRAVAAAGRRVIVCDATTPEHVRAIAAGVALSGMPALPVDPGGFTVALAEALGLTPFVHARTAALQATARAATRCVLAVLGSATATAEMQVDEAVGRGALSVVDLCAEDVAAGGGRHDSAVERAVRDLLAGPAVAGVRVVPATAANAAPARAAVARVLAEVAARVLAGRRIEGLYLSGGAVARAVLDRIGVEAVAVEGEVLPLAARGRLAGGPYHGLSIVTKGGMVGEPDAIVRCLQALGTSAGGGLPPRARS